MYRFIQDDTGDVQMPMETGPQGTLFTRAEDELRRLVAERARSTSLFSDESARRNERIQDLQDLGFRLPEERTMFNSGERPRMVDHTRPGARAAPQAGVDTSLVRLLTENYELRLLRNRARVTAIDGDGFRLTRTIPTDPETTELVVLFPAGDRNKLCNSNDTSSISLEEIEPDHVNLGWGKCLNREDLEGLRAAGQRWTNPETREPFTPLQTLAGEVLLMGGTVRYEQRPN